MNVHSQTPIRILPLGNSITYDDNIQDETDPRPAGDRIAYRYTLFQLLNDAGYVYDFVGSENSGNNYFNDPEFDDNAGFPGIETWQLTNLLKTGYNAITGMYVTPGPYLIQYPADIILLHIGTNNRIESAVDVESLLDTIRFFQPNVLILVARIINRQTYDLSTTYFNDNVETMVSFRGDNRIRMVDMESGANIDYSTEMADNLHPNPAGFEKMGMKWFEAIENLNHVPEIEPIPEQVSTEGTPFPGLMLDAYVSDEEDPDASLSWTFSVQPGSHLEVSLDENRILNVVPDPGWLGSETLELRVEDSGSGIRRKSDSVEVLYTVEEADRTGTYRVPMNMIYPNPATNEINLRSGIEGPFTIEIESIDGKLIYRTEAEGPAPRIDLSSVGRGTWFITVRTGNFSATEKLIKLF